MAAQLDSVLVVDGDERFAGDLAAGLRARKADVEVVSSAEAMLEAIDRCRPQVILLSVELPKSKGAGYLACNKLKKDPVRAAIPVVLMSSSATEEDFAKHRKLATHADDYLRKPFSDDELFRKLGNILGLEISHGDFEQLQEKVHDFLGEKADLEADIRRKSEAIAALEQELAQAREQLAAHRHAESEALKQEQVQLEQLRAEAGHVQASLAHARGEVTLAESRLTELQAQQESLQDALRVSEEGLGELAERRAVLEGEIELLQGQKSEAEAEVGAMQQSAQKLGENVRQLELQGARLAQELATERSHIENLAQSLRTAAENLDRLARD